MLMDKPLVSIVCTAYNHEPYIRDCLEGFVMQQTNFPFEVLINDDASTDHTADIIREYEAKYPDIIKPIYQTENQYSKGVRINITYCYPRAQGKYIALCEGDDFWCDPHKLQIQFDFMESHPDYSMCGTGIYVLDHIDHTYRPIAFPKIDFDGKSTELSLKILSCEHPFRTPTIFFRKQVFIEAREDIERDTKDAPMGDLQIFFHMSLRGKIKFITKRMAAYRKNTSSVSHYNNVGQYNMFVKKCQRTICKIAAANGFAEYVPELSSLMKKNAEYGNRQKSRLLKKLIWFKRLINGYFRNYNKFIKMSPHDRVRFRID